MPVRAGRKKRAKKIVVKEKAKVTDVSGIAKALDEDDEDEVKFISVQTIQADEVELAAESAATLHAVEFRVPQWWTMVEAATGIMMLRYWVEQEIARRRDPQFFPAYPDLFRMVNSFRFELVIAAFLVLNCAAIGWQCSLPEHQHEDLFIIFQHIFTVIFLMEWIARVMSFGVYWIFLPSSFSDTAFVFILGVIPLWMLEPMGWLDQASQGPLLRMLTTLRILRLSKLVYEYRTDPMFQDLWNFIQGAIHSAQPLLSSVAVGVVVCYIGGMLATKLIGHDEYYREDEKVQELFGDMLKSMYTMFQVMTLDLWYEEIGKACVKKDFNTILFFDMYVVIAFYVFWNLVTTLIIDNAFEQKAQDLASSAKQAEEEKESEMRKLVNLFLLLDEDMSGKLTTQEFFGSLGHPQVRQVLDQLQVSEDELKIAWDLLSDGAGELNIKEFAEGLRRMKGASKALDILHSNKRMRVSQKAVRALQREEKKLSWIINEIQTDVTRVVDEVRQVSGLFQEIYHRLSVQADKMTKEDAVRKRNRAKGIKSGGSHKMKTAGADDDDEEEEEDGEGEEGEDDEDE